MSIFNRRNALFGWLAWLTAKRVLKRKARSAVPVGGDAGRAGVSAGAAAALATAVGALLFWRRRRGADAGPDEYGQ